MNKIHIKLIAMALALTLSVSVVIMSSYAWMVLSSNPAATGIQVVIGGGNTILVAPDVEWESDGKTYHIPGRFSDKMNFMTYSDSYGYLAEVGGLTPVSTSDGIDWIIAGNKVDSFLEHANLPKYVTSKDENGNETETENPAIREGNYIYLDFWVVAPAGDYTLRVSTDTSDGETSGGSFVIDLPVPVKDEKTGVISLADSEGSAAAAVRIGFLANPVGLTDDTMLCYTNSPYNDRRFTALRGFYYEPQSGSYDLDSNNFVIYEPNADCHPGKGEEFEGIYVQTKPLTLNSEGKIVPDENIWDRLAVQLKSSWITREGQSERFIDQIFEGEANLKGVAWEDRSESDIMAEFYVKRLQGQFSQYVSKGGFIKNSSYFKTEGVLNSNGHAAINEFTTYGVTENVEIIKLERNIPQKIRMFIWLEGQDIDCAASAKSATFAVNIELAGGNE